MDQKMIIRTADSVFLNSKSIFVEYIDIIRSPYFLFMYGLATAPDVLLKDPFDLTELRKLKDAEEVAEWYYRRRSQNPLYDIIPDDKISMTTFSKVDEFMDAQLSGNPSLVSDSSELNFVNVLGKLMSDSVLVEKAYVWYPYNNQVIREDVHKIFEGENVEFMYGNIGDCIKRIPEDSTYVFSDVSNILVLEELGKLNLSSIIYPVDFAYNLDEDGEPLIDFEGLKKDYTFKINQFVATAK